MEAPTYRGASTGERVATLRARSLVRYGGMRMLLALVVLLALAGVAAADDPAVLGGRVTDVLGKPIPHARVYVLPRSDEVLQTSTDAGGRYAVELAASGAYAVVIAVGSVHTYRQVVVAEHGTTTLDVEVETDITGGEVINIVDTRLPPPAVPPKPAGFHDRKSLPYSAEAMERDAWARAFVLLDIDERGEVSRIKLLKRPGFGLDQIAIDEAFALGFEPARDGAGKAVRTYVVWDMEWPSWGWLVGGGGTTAGRPVAYDGMYRYGRLNPNVARDAPPAGAAVAHQAPTDITRAGLPVHNTDLAPRTVNRYSAQPLPLTAPQPLSRVRCAGTGPLDLDLQNHAYRDCSRPDLRNVDALPWITRATAKTALAAIDSTRPQIVRGPRRSRVPALVATGVTGLLAAGLLVSYVEYDRYANGTSLAFTAPEARINRHERQVAELARWNHAMLGFAGALVASGAATAFLWGRSQTRESFSVQPARGGGAITYGRAF